jgi:pimeloyl-ACP methyl ester carboxylesterase
MSVLREDHVDARARTRAIEQMSSTRQISTKSFSSWDGLEIAYHEAGPTGASPPVILHHGFAADAHANWVAPGVLGALLAAGRRVIAPDARGHGHSEKPHDPARYGEDQMARDLAVLLDLLGQPQVDVVGYSMGAIVSLILASSDARVHRLVVGGIGSGVIECGGVDRRAISNEAIIAALRSDDPASIEDPRAAAFRQLADALRADREALVAQASSIFRGTIELQRISAATLVLAGEQDPLAVRPEVLARAIPNARLQMLKGDHMAAVLDPRFSESIVEFLS